MNCLRRLKRKEQSRAPLGVFPVCPVYLGWPYDRTMSLMFVALYILLTLRYIYIDASP